jgi:putative hydroxymethylpyrimidine transport system substrate-binding protein
LPRLLKSVTAIAAALSCFVLGGSALAASPTSVHVELDWIPNPDHSSLYYGLQEGTFKAQGLNVSFQPPSNATDVDKLVALNRVDLGISYENQMFFDQESHLPVEAVASIIPVPLSSLIVAPSAHVTTLAQMKGKTIGITGLQTDQADYTMLLRQAHLTKSEVHLVTVGENLVPAILSGKVNAIFGGYRNVEAIQIAQELGEKPSVFPLTDLGIPSYSELVIIANGPRLRSDPTYATLVREFVKGLVAGTNGARAHPQLALSVMEKATQYTKKFLQVSVPYTLTLMAPTAGLKTGCLDLNNWKHYGAWMKREKLITDIPQVAGLATNAYLPYSC